MHITKWKKSMWKGHTLYDSNYMTSWKGETMENKNWKDQGLPEGGEREGWIEGGYRDFYGSENILYNSNNGYMSLYICPDPQTVQSIAWTVI